MPGLAPGFLHFGGQACVRLSRMIFSSLRHPAVGIQPVETSFAQSGGLKRAGHETEASARETHDTQATSARNSPGLDMQQQIQMTGDFNMIRFTQTIRPA